MKKIHIVIIGVVILIAIIVIAVSVGVVLSKKDSESKGSVKGHPENEAYRYGKAAVATDSAICSKVCYTYNGVWGFRIPLN